jgi:TRAP-type C4-dicarboxylate transport system permease small subunit
MRLGERVTRTLDKPMNSFYNLLVNLSIFMFALVVVLVTVNVILRYLFGSSLPFGNAMSRYFTIWFSLLLIGPLLLRDEHLGVDALVRKFSLKIRFYIRLVELVLIIGLSGLLTYWGWQYASTFGFITTDPSTGIDMFWFYSSLWVSGALLFIFGVFKAIQTVSNPSVMNTDYERQYGTSSIDKEYE